MFHISDSVSSVHVMNGTKTKGRETNLKNQLTNKPGVNK